MMEFTIGVDAACSDGPCGTVSRLIVEPRAEAVTHLVIDPKRRNAPSRLVPVELVEATAAGIRLRCTRAEFDALDPAEETDLLSGGAGSPVYDPELGGGSPGGRGVDLSMAYLSQDAGTQVTTHDTIPVGEVDVSRGEHVSATDGLIGQIRGLVIDPRSHHVTHVLLEEGHLWGRKEVAIPITSVRRVGGIIQLNLSKQQVQDLPPVAVGHPAPPG